MFGLTRIQQTVLAAALLTLLALLWQPTPIVASNGFAQWSQKSDSTDETANGDEVAADDAVGGPIDDLADVRKAVVQIEAVGTFVDPDEGLQANAAGRGSGFIIDESGIAVTNNHVVTGGALFRVYLDGEEEPRNARVLGVSECADLAVIDIQGDGFPYLNWYEGPIRVGLDVYAVGFPLGDPEFTMTRGIVSKEQAGGDTSWASVDEVLQHDADINPGNSGGPLVDENGAVVGINYRLNQAGQYFAISRDEALGIIEELRRGQDVASLGINSEAVSDGEDLYGIWATSVESGSPADEVGIKPGDILLNLEGLDLATDGTMATYCEILRSHGPDDVLALTVLRFDTEEVLEGQINGRALEPSFTLADTISDDDSDVDEPSATDTVEAYSDYNVVSDEQGIIAVEVPVEWGDVEEYVWTAADDEQIGIQLWAASDVEEFANNWSIPGLVFSFADGFSEDTTTSDLLDGVDYSTDCTFAERTDLPEGFFSGQYDIWESCGGVGTTAMIMALSPETEDYLLRVEIYSVTDADLEALDRILDSFVISPPTAELPTDDGFSHATIGDIDLSNRTNDYVLLEDPAFSTLVPDTWTDTVSEEWLIDDEPTGLTLLAAPDVEAYLGFWSAPGLEVYMAEVGDEEVDVYEILDEGDFADACTYEERIAHEHTIYGITYQGAFDVWNDCGEEGNTLIVLSALSDPADHLVIVYFQAVEDGDYEAFDMLQRSFYVNTAGTSTSIDDEESAAEARNSASLEEYVTLEDEQEAFTFSAPLSWDDVINDDWVLDGDVVGRALTAAPDLVGFEERWDTPGVFLGFSQIFAEEFTPDTLLDALDFSDECVYDSRYVYDDTVLDGSYDIWESCGDVAEQDFIVLAANPDGSEDAIILLYVNIVTDADVMAFEQLLSSLTVGDSDGLALAQTADDLATVTIIAQALNVRSGPGTSYTRIDAVGVNDELRVAGQSDNCAWLQILTADGQPGWVSGATRYVTLNGNCDLIPEVDGPEAIESTGSTGSTGSTDSSSVGSAQGCYTFQNQLGAELNVTITRSDGGLNTTFLVPPKAESRQCFDPGEYTYTFDAPPPWNSVNGELTINAGDNFVYPISGE